MALRSAQRELLLVTMGVTIELPLIYLWSWVSEWWWPAIFLRFIFTPDGLNGYTF